jgi:hypothetical protein
MSTAYICGGFRHELHRCGEMFAVNVGARTSFEQFFEYGCLWVLANVPDKCPDCQDDGYGRIEVCARHCSLLADETAAQEIRDPNVARHRDVWVKFLRHCAGHDGLRVTF